jgi:hypothetical protein
MLEGFRKLYGATAQGCCPEQRDSVKALAELKGGTGGEGQTDEIQAVG